MSIINDEFCLNFKCTYSLIDNTEESNTLYNIQFLQFFNINEYDGKIIDKKIQILYKFLDNLNEKSEIISIYETLYVNNLNIIDMLLSMDNTNNKYYYTLNLLLSYQYLPMFIEFLYKKVNNICTKNIVKKILDYIKNDIN
tara:strand:- start:931 stop:1353 length:423 start_codon:yes stop_codon:yes gene_type:complete